MGDSTIMNGSDNNLDTIKVTDIENYKSAFARSVAINSKRKHFDDSIQSVIRSNNNTILSVPEESTNSTLANEVEVIRLRKECQNLVEENRRLNNGLGINTRSCNGIGNTNDLPVESFVLQSQVNTLQWQLKQTESSRLMYREVMEQMVCFLERAHRSLDLLQERLQSPNSSTSTLRRQSCVPRSRSVHQVSTPPPPVLRAHSTAQIQQDTSDFANFNGFKDYTWRKQKLQEPTPEEISPETLSQEAFRLLRTAQSLLNTREPDLVNHCNSSFSPSTNEIPKEDKTDIEQADQEFLTQLSREFPPQNSLKLANTNTPPQISTAFNRKLSLQRTSLNSSKRNSLIETDFPVLPSTVEYETPFSGKQKRHSVSSNQSLPTSSPNSTLNRQSDMNYSFDNVKEKSRSPPMGSVSSAEDESGFSSMSSFQEIGLPVVNSTIIETLEKGNDSPIIRNNSFTSDKIKEKLCWLNQDIGLPSHDSKATPSHPIHRRWSSNPVESAKRDPLRVLWV